MKLDQKNAVISRRQVIEAFTPVSVGDDESCVPSSLRAIQQNGTVTCFEITCSCGNLITVDCVYETAT